MKRIIFAMVAVAFLSVLWGNESLAYTNEEIESVAKAIHDDLYERKGLDYVYTQQKYMEFAELWLSEPDRTLFFWETSTPGYVRYWLAESFYVQTNGSYHFNSYAILELGPNQCNFYPNSSNSEKNCVLIGTLEDLYSESIDFSQAVYDPEMGHLVGLNKGFKRYSIDTGFQTSDDYIELSWFSETSGGYELLDNYYDDSFVKIELSPGLDVRKAISKKYVKSVPNTQKFLYDIRQKSLAAEYDLYNGMTDLRLNLDSLTYNSQSLLSDWYSEAIQVATELLGVIDYLRYEWSLNFYIYFTPYVLSEGTLYYGDTVRVFIPSPNKDGTGTITLEVGKVESDTDASGNIIESFISTGSLTTGNYTPGSGKTYTDAVLNSENNSSTSSGASISLDNWNGTVESFVSEIGQVPLFFSVVFAFLPVYILRLVELTIGAICIMRILGR